MGAVSVRGMIISELHADVQVQMLPMEDLRITDSGYVLRKGEWTKQYVDLSSMGSELHVSVALTTDSPENIILLDNIVFAGALREGEVIDHRQSHNCSAGEYHMAGMEQCAQCPAGLYSAAGSNQCARECPPGSAASVGNQAAVGECVSCPIGTYSSGSDCTLCAPGLFDHDGDASTECMECASGRYTDKLGATGCVVCPVGRHSAKSPRDSEATCESLGCTDPWANNFDAHAATDDGSCAYGCSTLRERLGISSSQELQCVIWSDEALTGECRCLLQWSLGDDPWADAASNPSGTDPALSWQGCPAELGWCATSPECRHVPSIAHSSGVASIGCVDDEMGLMTNVAGFDCPSAITPTYCGPCESCDLTHPGSPISNHIEPSTQMHDICPITCNHPRCGLQAEETKTWWCSSRGDTVVGWGNYSQLLSSPAQAVWGTRRNHGTIDASHDTLDVSGRAIVVVQGRREDVRSNRRFVNFGRRAEVQPGGNLTMRFVSVIKRINPPVLLASRGYAKEDYRAMAAGLVVGGAIRNRGQMHIDHANFTGNQASSLGGAIYLDKQSFLGASNAVFERNAATDGGGAIYMHLGSVARLSDCVFRENACSTGGGAISLYHSELHVANSDFTHNNEEASQNENDGGAIKATGGMITVNSCTFTNNRASVSGAAIWADRTEVFMAQSWFSCNEANLLGEPRPGLQVYISSPPDIAVQTSDFVPYEPRRM